MKCCKCKVELSRGNWNGLCRKCNKEISANKWKIEKETLRHHPLRKVSLEETARAYNANHPFDFSATYKRYEEFISPKGLRTQP